MEKIKVHLGFDRFPRKYTGDGENLSPPIKIENAKGESMALIMDDPDAPRGTWVHWVAWNLPVVSSVPEGIPTKQMATTPISIWQGRHSGDDIGYDGPCPPRGHGPHRYFVKVYILDSRLDLPPGSSKQDLEKAMQGRVLQQGEAMATYER